MTFLSQCITSCQILYGCGTMNVRVSQDFIPSRLYTCTCASILLFILIQNSLLVLKIKRRKMPFSTYSATSKLLKSNEKKEISTNVQNVQRLGLVSVTRITWYDLIRKIISYQLPKYIRYTCTWCLNTWICSSLQTHWEELGLYCIRVKKIQYT